VRSVKRHGARPRRASLRPLLSEDTRLASLAHVESVVHVLRTAQSGKYRRRTPMPPTARRRPSDAPEVWSPVGESEVSATVSAPLPFDAASSVLPFVGASGDLAPALVEAPADVPEGESATATPEPEALAVETEPQSVSAAQLADLAHLPPERVAKIMAIRERLTDDEWARLRSILGVLSPEALGTAETYLMSFPTAQAAAEYLRSTILPELVTAA
jgi:hypothetical protein